MTISVGDKFVSLWDEVIEIKLVGNHGELLYSFDDDSLGFSYSHADFLETNAPLKETNGWINVIHDTSFNEIFFGDGVYVTRANAENAFLEEDVKDWVLLDTTYITWSNQAGATETLEGAWG